VHIREGSAAAKRDHAAKKLPRVIHLESSKIALSLVRDAEYRNRYNRQSFAHYPTLRGYARLENLASLQGCSYRRFNVCG